MSEVPEDTRRDRRSLLARVLMWSSVILGYGLGAKHFFSYLLPARGSRRTRELYVGSLDDLPVGKSLTIRTPSGESFVMARTGTGLRVLSSICPHLGCRVHWEADRERFLCPCHQGVFNPEGVAIAGPPADAGQRLQELTAVVRGRSIFVEIEES